MAQPLPTVSRVLPDELIELVYDPECKTTALLRCAGGNWSLHQEICLPSGEILVPYRAGNSLISSECVTLASTPSDYGSKDKLIADVRDYLHRYIDLPEVFKAIAAHYVLLTWVYDAFNEVPYLRFRGEFGSGKTRALLALGLISYKSFFASGASTVSPIFHVLNAFRGTLVLDEADLRFSGKTVDLVKILNNGSMRGLPVLRTLQNSAKEFNPAAFQVFGPKIVAMRGRFSDPALESRFLSQDMGSWKLRDDIPIQLPNTLHEEARQLRNKLLDYRLKNFRRVRAAPDRLIDGILPRLNQTAAPLFALVDDVHLRDSIAAMLRRAEERLKREMAHDIRCLVLRAALETFVRSNADAVPIADIAREASRASDRAITPRDVGFVLREQGVLLRKSHGTIVMPRSSLAAAQRAVTGSSLS